MDSELICPLCEDQYTDDNPPRLLTSCGHTYCQNCLKKIMTEKNGCYKIVCPEDGEMVTLKDSSMSSFPKNIALLKIIESKSNSMSFKDSSFEMSKIVKNDQIQEDQDAQDLVDAISSSQNNVNNSGQAEPDRPQETTSKPEMCLLHQKPLEVVCVFDLKRICANCAIFGEHKGHQFKSLQEIQKDRMDYYTSIIDIMDKKETISSRISNKETCSSIMEILENKKEKMKKAITQKYKKLMDAIQLKQKETFKSLESVIGKNEIKLKNLMKIDEQVLSKYNTWEQKSYNQIKILESDDFEGKLQLLFCESAEQSEDVLEEGDKILAEMAKQEENLINEVEVALQNIGLEFNQEIFNHIDNFAEVYEEAKKRKVKRSATSVKPESSTPVAQTKSKTLALPSHTKKEEKSHWGQSSLHSSQKLSIESVNSPRMKESSTQVSTIKKQPVNMEESLLEDEQDEIFLKKPQFVKLETQDSPQPTEKYHIEPFQLKTQEKQKKVNEVKKQEDPIEYPTASKKGISLEKVERPNKKKLVKIKVPEKYEKVIEGLGNDNLDLIDLTNAELGDASIAIISQFLQGSKAKTVKFIRNKINDDTVNKILPYMRGVVTLNLSQNFLTDRVLDILANGRSFLPAMRNIILSQNKIIERKHKNKIDKLRNMNLTVSV